MRNAGSGRLPAVLLTAAIGVAGCAAHPGAPPRPVRPVVKSAKAPVAPRATSRPGKAPHKKKAAPTPAAPSPCEGSNLALERVWQAPGCRVREQSPPDNLDSALRMTVHAKGPLESGRKAVVEVVFENRTRQTLPLLFHESCLGVEPQRLFDVAFRDRRGASAPAQRSTSLPGVLSALDRPCPRPLVEAKLTPGGRATIELEFVVSAERVISPPALRAGPLRPGRYELVVTAPLVAAEPIQAELDVAVR